MTETEAKIRQKLDEFWEDNAIPSGNGDSIVDALVAPVESMTAVDVLTTLDGIVGKKIPSSVIQPGGYMTKDEFIEKLTEKVMAFIGGES